MYEYIYTKHIDIENDYFIYKRNFVTNLFTIKYIKSFFFVVPKFMWREDRRMRAAQNLSPSLTEFVSKNSLNSIYASGL